MADYIDIDGLADAPANVLQSDAYTMVLTPLMNTFRANKLNIGALSAFFLPTDRLNDINDSLVSLRDNLEKIVDEFVTEDYLIDNNYITKEYANRQRRRLLTDDNLKSVISKYITSDQVSAQFEEADRELWNTVNSTVATLLGPATTARGAESQNVQLDSNSTDMMDKLDELGSSEGE